MSAVVRGGHFYPSDGLAAFSYEQSDIDRSKAPTANLPKLLFRFTSSGGTGSAMATGPGAQQVRLDPPVNCGNDATREWAEVQIHRHQSNNDPRRVRVVAHAGLDTRKNGSRASGNRVTMRCINCIASTLPRGSPAGTSRRDFGRSSREPAFVDARHRLPAHRFCNTPL